MRYLLVPTDKTAETLTLEVPDEIITNKLVEKPKKLEKPKESKKQKQASKKTVQTSRSVYGKTYHSNIKRPRSQ